MINRAKSDTKIKQYERFYMVGVSGVNEIIVYGSDGCFRRVEMETTIDRLTHGKQLVIVDVFHRSRSEDTLEQFRCDGQIGDRLIRVEVIRIKLRFLEQRTHDVMFLYSRSTPGCECACVRA